MQAACLAASPTVLTLWSLGQNLVFDSEEMVLPPAVVPPAVLPPAQP